MPATDVLIVSLGSTAGLRAADAELAASILRCGASVAVTTAQPPREIRTLALTDLVWAKAARRAAVRGITEHEPRSIIYSTTTAALLWPRPGAIRFDALAAATRPGRHGFWQRPLERRRLAQAPLLLPHAHESLAEVPGVAPGDADCVVLAIPVEPSGLGEPWATRELAAITYAADPRKKGLERVLAAWAAVRRDGETLLVAGLATDRLPDPQAGVVVSGQLDRDAYRELLRRSRVFVTAPVREDYGIAQLEALCDGCVLVTTPAPGPYVALPIARELDQRLVSEDLAGALRAALDEPAPRYTARSIDLLAPFARSSVDQVVRDEVLPRLLR